MFKINDETRNKKGYILIDRILIAQPSENGLEPRVARIELYGKAIKTSIYDDRFSTIVETTDYFADDSLTISIIKYPSNSDDLYIYEYNKTIIVSNQEQMSNLREYASLVMANPDIFDYSSAEAVDINSLGGIEFEHLCGTLLQKMGFDVEQTKASGDGGIDLIATNSQPLLEGKYIIQCKRFSGSVGEPIIRDLYGVVCSERANKGILITTGTFTNTAIRFAAGKQLELIDGKKLSQLLEQHQITVSYSSVNFKTNLIELLEDKTVLFDIEEYKYSIKRLRDNPDDELTRISLIKQLVELVFGNLPEIRDYSDITLVTQEIKKQIRLFNMHCSKSNRNIQYLIDVLSALNIQLNIVEGNYTAAIDECIDLLHKPELYVPSDFTKMSSELKNNTGILFSVYAAAYNAIQIATYLENAQLVKRLLNMSEGLIKAVSFDYSIKANDTFDQGLSEMQKQYAQNQYELCNKIETLNSLYFIDDQLLENCIQFVFYKSTYFTFQATAFAIAKGDNSLIIKYRDIMGVEIDQVFAVIDGISNKVNEPD